jgi:hypothetical protein
MHVLMQEYGEQKGKWGSVPVLLLGRCPTECSASPEGSGTCAGGGVVPPEHTSARKFVCDLDVAAGR